MTVHPDIDGEITTTNPTVGQELTIVTTENVPDPDVILEYGISDNQGNEWVPQIGPTGATFTTVPTEAGDLSVKITLFRPWDEAVAEPLQLATNVAGLGPSPAPPAGDLVPGQVAGKVIVGMSADDWNARLAEVGGHVGADHFFVGSWSPTEFINKVKEAKSKGVYAYGNMKTGDWGNAANGGLDVSAGQLASDLANLGWPCHICFHHEPGFKTPNGGGESGTGFEWRDMNARLSKLMMAEAPDTLVAGCVDNGFKFSPNTGGQGWTKSELDQLYTDEFLDAIGDFGADYYDGATTRSNGEAAYLKIQRAEDYLTGRGYTGHASVGEFNFVRPSDMKSMFSTVAANPNRWWIILAFNSDKNNRADIPTIGQRWNYTHGFDNDTDRLNAFKQVLAEPLASA